MNSFMTRIYEDFKNEKENWCALPISQFSNSIYSDYNNKHYNINVFEQYYLLRFTPMYITEYYQMYKEFLLSYKKDKLRVLSIGVGAGLDYIGLNVALAGSDIDLEYMGMDVIDWKYRDSDIDFVQIDLKDILVDARVTEFIKKGVDVIVFPKSIIEIDLETLKVFSDVLVDNGIDDIWILNSFIRSKTKISGVEELNVVIDNLTKKGYSLDEEIYPKSTDGRINYSAFGIDYKSTWMNDIYSFCSQKCIDSKRNTCNISNQYPMLNMSNTLYGIYNMKKDA